MTDHWKPDRKSRFRAAYHVLRGRPVIFGVQEAHVHFDELGIIANLRQGDDFGVRALACRHCTFHVPDDTVVSHKNSPGFRDFRREDGV